MRNALILLVVVALVIVALGAANGSITFDFDMVFGTWTAVSLLWVAVVAAVILLVVGLVAAWLARSDGSRTRRKLEVELQSTYVRLRAAEARLPEEPQTQLPEEPQTQLPEAPEPTSPSEPAEPSVEVSPQDVAGTDAAGAGVSSGG